MPSLLSAFKAAQAGQRRLIGVVAGSGEVARSAVISGADMLIALNAGVFRNLGGASFAAYMPYGEANEMTERLLRHHLLPHAGAVPVVAGMFGPGWPEGVRPYLERLRALEVNAVVNWPALGQIDGVYGETLAEEGLGVDGECQTLRYAKELGFTTLAFAYTAEQVRAFCDAGVAALILSLGATRGIGDVREKRDRLQESIAQLNEMVAAARASSEPPACLAYGGVVTTPEDLEEIFRFSAVEGFAGGSVFERLPLRDVAGSVVRRFKGVAAEHLKREGESGLGQMLGQSPPMRELFSLVRRIAPFDVNVYIEGESGTGKELVATTIHRMSLRAHRAFVTLNCGAIPETLLESELFGHEKGAFTGAERRRLGKFELAHRGTLFLDEIANLSPHGQVALLRALQQREIARVGGEEMIPVDVRVLAASNQSLPELVARGQFRADLYHRLNQISVQVPPLRERLDDLPNLAEDVLARLEVQLNRKFSGFAPGFLRKLRQHLWSGNVRELQAVILQAALLEDGPLLEGGRFTPQATETLPLRVGSGSGEAWAEKVRKALLEAGGNKSRAAAILGVTRKTLYAWIERLEALGPA